MTRSALRRQLGPDASPVLAAHPAAHEVALLRASDQTGLLPAPIALIALVAGLKLIPRSEREDTRGGYLTGLRRSRPVQHTVLVASSGMDRAAAAEASAAQKVSVRD
ncbi:hypothetical protein ACFRFL_39245 [Streptomyces sp. NPDC056708]|uniref:hypothetical protein n=1 Tax=unclassified Streptomyces TaxID=2593676 RepID=UPI00367F1512